MTKELLEKLDSLSHEDLMALLDEFQPYDVANMLPSLSEERQLELLQLVPSDLAADALEHLDYDHQYQLLDHLPEDQTRAILAAMSSDAVVDLIGSIHPRQVKEILRNLSEKDLGLVRQLMSYPETSAGGRMSTDYLAVRTESTAEQVIAHFRKVGRDVEAPNYIYVVTKEGRLAGVASLRDILLSEPRALVADIMYTKIVSVQAQSDQEEAAKVLSQYDFVAIPVINGGGRMVGVITADDVIDVLEQEATEDAHLSGGSLPLEQPYMQTSIPELLRKRIGWLLALFLLQSITSNILQHYEGYIDQVTALAFFIPLLIGTGGNSGSQASTLVIRAMALGEVTLGDFTKVVFREARVGMVMGVAMAVAMMLRSMLQGGSLALGLTVAATISLIVLVASTAGAALPLIGRRLGFDPAVFSSPMITTVVDAFGLIIYFQMARMILGLGI